MVDRPPTPQAVDTHGQPDDPVPFDHIFHHDDADVVIRSVDGVDFRTHRLFLSKSSHFFSSLFTLPQPSPGTNTGDDDPDNIDGLPRVPVDEKAEVVDLLLKYLYPMPNPEITSLHLFSAVLDAALKYDVEHVVDILRTAWPQLAEGDPLRAFALACLRGQVWHDEARIAARLSLEKPIWPLEPPLEPEFKLINADTIVRLMSYQRKCGTEARKLTENREWGMLILDAQTCVHCSRRDKNQSQQLQLTDWLGMFMKLLGPALVAQPCAKTVRDPNLLNISIANSYQTPRCELPMHSVDRINCVVGLIAQEIEKIVSNVTLEFDL